MAMNSVAVMEAQARSTVAEAERMSADEIALCLAGRGVGSPLTVRYGERGHCCVAGEHVVDNSNGTVVIISGVLTRTDRGWIFRNKKGVSAEVFALS